MVGPLRFRPQLLVNELVRIPRQYDNRYEWMSCSRKSPLSDSRGMKIRTTRRE